MTSSTVRTAFSIGILNYNIKLSVLFLSSFPTIDQTKDIFHLGWFLTSPKLLANLTSKFNWIALAFYHCLEILQIFIYLFILSGMIWASLVAQRLKCLPAMRETWVRSLGREDPLEKEMVIHSSILAWRIPMDERAWWAIVRHKESDMTEWIHFTSFYYLKEY